MYIYIYIYISLRVAARRLGGRAAGFFIITIISIIIILIIISIISISILICRPDSWKPRGWFSSFADLPFKANKLTKKCTNIK